MRGLKMVVLIQKTGIRKTHIKIEQNNGVLSTSCESMSWLCAGIGVANQFEDVCQTIIEPTLDMWTRENKKSNIVVNDPKGGVPRFTVKSCDCFGRTDFTMCGMMG